MSRLLTLHRTAISVAVLAVSAVLIGGQYAHVRATAQVVPSNTWAATGDLAEARAGAASALMFGGQVLVTGGMDSSGAVTATVERYSPGAGEYVPTTPMQSPRANHTATLLADGRVLIAGGITSGGQAVSSAEVYDPATNAWTFVAPMSVARAGQTATTLYDGRVVVVGGHDGNQSVDSIEVFDPQTDIFTLSIARMAAPRTGHATVQLYDGTLLITGGFDGTNPLSSTDIYDPWEDTVTAGPSLTTARAGHSATTLLSGKVLVAGGAGESGELASGEVYDPASHVFLPTANAMLAARQHHQAFLLPHNNQVLIVGGFAGAGGNAVATAEVYVEWQGDGGTFYEISGPASARAWATGAALSFREELTIRTGPNDGLLLLAGGSPKSDAENPVAISSVYGFATVVTDKADYAPGSTVTITGSGWVPGETVSLTLVEDPLFDTHELTPVVADGSGHIISTEFIPDAGDAYVRFYLTASGGQSQAQTSFTDAPVARTWTGANAADHTDWNIAANWSPAAVPLVTDTISIPTSPSGGSFFPVFSSGTSPALGNMSIATGASLTVSGGTLNVSGTITVTGTLTVSGGAVNNSAGGADIADAGAISVSSGSLTTPNAKGIAGAGSLSISGGTVAVGTAGTGGADFKTSGAVNLSGGTFKIGHDYKPSGTVTATGGTVEFLGAAGNGAFPAGTYPFYNIQIVSGADPGFNNQATNVINVANSWTFVGNPAASFGISAGRTWTAGTLFFDSAQQEAGSWGNGGTATNQNSTHFPTSTTGILNVSTGPVPTKLAITAVNGGSDVISGTSFSVTVESQSSGGGASNVTADTAFSLTIGTGTGALSGTVSGTITAGTSSKVVTGVIYTKASGETGVTLTATRTSGDSLTAGTSAGFTVVGVASRLGFVQSPTDAAANVSISPAVTVEVQDANGSRVTSSTASIAMAIGTNPAAGTLSGTTPVSAISGVATFSDLSINNIGTGYTLAASSGGLTGAISGTFNITAGSCVWNTNTSGNWNTASNWNCPDSSTHRVPLASDAVTISRGTNTLVVTVDADAVAYSVSLGTSTGTNGNVLTMASGKSLTVGTDITMTRPGGNTTTALNVNAGTVTVGGKLTLAGTNTGAGRIDKITITTGTLSVAGDLVFETGAAASNVIDMSGGAGVLNLGAAFTFTVGTLTPGTTSIVNFNGTSAQTIPIGVSSVAYNSIRVNNTSSAGATLSAAISTTNVTGNLRVGVKPDGSTQAGALLSNGGFAIVGNAGKTFEVADGATFKMTGTSGMPTGFGTTTLNTSSTVDFAGGAQSVAALAYANVILSGTGNKTMVASTSVTGNLSIAPTGSAKALLTNGVSLSVGSLKLAGVTQVRGSWGSNGSAATNKTDTYFVAANTGILNVGTALTLTWDGGGADNNWTTAANWLTDEAPIAGDSLVFDSTGVGVRPLPNNNFTAGTSFGTVTVAVGGYTLGGNSVSLTTGLAVTNASGTSFVSQIINGAGGVSKSGAGTLTLSGGNGYTGTTAISGGITQISAANNLGASTALTFTSGRLYATTAGFALAQTVTSNTPGGAEVQVDSGSLTFNGGWSGAGRLDKYGAGTMVLTGAYTATGKPVVDAGTLQMGSTGSLSTTNMDVMSGGAFDFNSKNISISTTLTIEGTGVSSGGALLNSTAATTSTLNGGAAISLSGDTSVGGAGNLVLPGAISGTSRALTKVGGGTLTLQSANTYSGNTTISAGTLALTGSGSIASSPVIDVAGGATFDVSATTAASTLGSGQTLQASGSTTGGTLATASGKGLTLGSTSPITFPVFTPSGSGGAVPLTLSGAGTLTLGASSPVTVTVSNSGTPLSVAGSPYKLIGKGPSGAVATLPGGTLTVDGDGVNGVASLAITSGELYLVVSPGALDHFAISSISSPQTAGTAITGVTLTAQDVNNNTVTSFTSTVAYSGTAGITGTSASFTSGVLSGVSVTPTTAGTSKTFIVTGATKTGTATFDVNSATLDHFLVEAAAGGSIGTQTAGVSFNIKVTAQDTYNNTVTSFTGGGNTVDVLSNRSCSSGCTTTAAFSSGVLGSHAVTLTEAGTLSTVTATRTSGGAQTGTSNTFTVTAGTATHLAFVQQPTDTAAGGTITPAVTVEVLDAFNNLVSTDNSTTVGLAIANNPSAGTLTGGSAVAVSSGVAAFTGLSIDNAGTGYTLAATSSPVLTGATSDAFDITAVNPDVVFNPSPVAFGPRLPGFTYTLPVTLTWNGAGSMTLSSITVPANVNGFDYVSDDCPASLATGESCTITVSFIADAGFDFGIAYTGVLSVADSAAGSPHTVALTGERTSWQPYSFNVGSVPVGATSANKVLKFYNISADAIETGASAVAFESGPFALVSDTCSSRTIVPYNSGDPTNPDAYCTVTLTFTPSVTGEVYGTMTVTSGSILTDTVYELQVRGTGTFALNVSPTGLNFGNVGLGPTGVTRSVTLTNPNGSPIALSGIDVTGTGFTMPGSSTCGATLAGGASCAVDVKFAPSTPGAGSGTLTVTSDATSSPVVALSGFGSFALKVAPAGLAFAATKVGMPSVAKVVTLTNTNSDAIPLDTIGSDLGDFTRTGGSCAAAVPANGNCTIEVMFTPAASGYRQGMLSIASVATGSPHAVSLAGAGTFVLKVSAGNLSYGSGPAGLAKVKTLTLTNVNGMPIHVSGLADDSADYAVTGGTCGAAPFDVPASGACTLDVTFTAGGSGESDGTLTITSDADYSPQTVALYGYGTLALKVSAGSLSYGSGPAGLAKVKTLTLTNVNGLPIHVSSTADDSADYAVTGGTCGAAPFNVPASGNCTLQVTFTAGGSGESDGTLTITSDADYSPHTVWLYGYGTLALKLSATSFSYGNTKVGTPKVKTLTLTNVNGLALSVSSLIATGDYAVTGGTCVPAPSSVPATGSCTVEVTFAPAATGARPGSLTITTNADSSPHVVTLSGNGT